MADLKKIVLSLLNPKTEDTERTVWNTRRK